MRVVSAIRISSAVPTALGPEQLPGTAALPLTRGRGVDDEIDLVAPVAAR